MTNRDEQHAHIPLWVDGYLRERLSSKTGEKIHPATVAMLMRIAMIFLGAMRHGRTTRPIRLGALARKHRIDERRLRRGAKRLEEEGLLRRLHESRNGLRTASHYQFAMTPSEAGNLAPCLCKQCVSRQGRQRPGPATARAVHDRVVDGPRKSSDLKVHTIERSNDGPLDQEKPPTKEKGEDPSLLLGVPSAEPAASFAQSSVDLDAPSRRLEKHRPTCNDRYESAGGCDTRFEAMLADLAQSAERPAIEPRARLRLWRAYREHPAGLAWVISEAYGQNYRGGYDPRNLVGLVLAKVRHGEHRVTLRAFSVGDVTSDEGRYLCADCDGTGYRVDGSDCDSDCIFGWHDLPRRRLDVLEQEHGVRLLDESKPVAEREPPPPLRAVK